MTEAPKLERVNISVRRDLHKRIERRAKGEGKTLQAFTEQMIVAGMISTKNQK